MIVNVPGAVGAISLKFSRGKFSTNQRHRYSESTVFKTDVTLPIRRESKK